MIKYPIPTSNEESVVALRQENPNRTARGRSRFVDKPGNRDLRLLSGPIAPDYTQIDGARGGMRIEFHAHRSAIPHANNLLFANPSQYFVRLGIEQHAVNNQVIATRE